MISSLSIPAMLAIGLTVNSTGFMLLMVLSAAVSAGLIAFNIVSLRHQSTCRASVFSVILLMLGIMVSNAGVGASSESGVLDPLGGLPGQIGAGLVIVGALCAIVALVQFAMHHRYRRGRKRALVALLGCLLFLAIAANLNYRARHPLPPKVIQSKVELLPDTISDMHAKPTPVRPPPVAAATPTPSVTPRPRLFPNVVTPTSE